MGWRRGLQLELMILLAGAGLATAQTAKPAAKPPAVAPATKPAEPAPTSVKQMLSPTRISYTYSGTKIDDGVTELEKSIGFSLHGGPDPIGNDEKKFSLDEKNQPMLSVISAFGQKTKTRIAPYSRGRNQPFILETIYDSFNCFYVPKQIDTAVMPYIATLTAHKEEGKYRLEMQIVLAAEPKVYIAAYVHSPNWEAMVDDQGVSLFMDAEKQKPAGSPERPLEFMQTGEVVSLWQRFQYPSAKAATIKHIRGAIPVLFGFNLQTKDLSFLLDDGKSTKLPYLQNTSITLSDYGRRPESHATYVMTMTVPRLLLPGGNMVDENAELSPMRFEASDSNNHVWDVRREHFHTSDKTIEYHLVFHPRFPIFDKDKDKRIHPEKFTIVAAGKTEGALIPFDFVDIPIPAVRK